MQESSQKSIANLEELRSVKMKMGGASTAHLVQVKRG
jgi:hypothetical protein